MGKENEDCNWFTKEELEETKRRIDDDTERKAPWLKYENLQSLRRVYPDLSEEEIQGLAFRIHATAWEHAPIPDNLAGMYGSYVAPWYLSTGVVPIVLIGALIGALVSFI